MEKQVCSSQGKIVVITGAGRGIGRRCAQAFAAEGARVVLVSRTEVEMGATAKLILEETPTAHVLIHPGDISLEHTAVQLFEHVASAWGPIDILVNNARIARVIPLKELDLSDWREVMDTNCTGPFLLTRELFRQCQRLGRGGTITNVASLSGIRGVQKFPGFSAYIASKFGVVGLTESSALEGKPLGIRVNCVAPGAVNTQMLKEVAPHLKAGSNADDIAHAILFLSNDILAKKITGSILEIHSNAE